MLADEVRDALAVHEHEHEASDVLCVVVAVDARVAVAEEEADVEGAVVETALPARLARGIVSNAGRSSAEAAVLDMSDAVVEAEIAVPERSEWPSSAPTLRCPRAGLAADEAAP